MKNKAMPEWLLKKENCIPQADKDTFVNKSILALLHILSKIKGQDGAKKSYVNTVFKFAFTLLLIILLSVSKNVAFVEIITVYLLVVLSFMKAHDIIKIVRLSFLMALFTFVILLPSYFWGNSYSSFMITAKVFASVTAVNILSHSAKWNEITSALKRFFVPDIFIFVLDVTIRYIVMLGEFSILMLYSLKVRSIGRNKRKYSSLSGITGTMFMKSKEMAEEMHSAMECRGFTGEYRVLNKVRVTVADGAYIIINTALLASFLYLEGHGF